MKRYLVAGFLIVLVPFAAAAECKPRYCPDSPTGDCNPRPSAPANSPDPNDKCVMTKDGCLSPRPKS